MQLDKEINTLLPKPVLNEKLWGKGLFLNEEVRDNLLKIAFDFIEKAKLDKNIVKDKRDEYSIPSLIRLGIKDIIVTGSIANYNWSKFSDIDLHLIIDFNAVSDKELMKNYLDAKKSLWNDKHVIEMFGHEVEIYVQDVKEPHYSTGVYSILKNKWLTRPKYITVDNLDRHSIVRKAKIITHYIEHLQDLHNKKEYEKVYELSDYLKEKIRKMRSSGLERDGEFSIENLAFKVLRRTGKLKKLGALQLSSYDAMLEV